MIDIIPSVPIFPHKTSGFDNIDIFDGQLLPDDSWIAIICGASHSKSWGSLQRSQETTFGGPTAASGASIPEDELPDGFYIAPRDVYMPDLMAVGDVLLGKLVSHPVR